MSKLNGFNLADIFEAGPSSDGDPAPFADFASAEIEDGFAVYPWFGAYGVGAGGTDYAWGKTPAKACRVYAFKTDEPIGGVRQFKLDLSTGEWEAEWAD